MATQRPIYPTLAVQAVVGNDSSAHVIRACPGCFREFPHEVRFCGICGETLIERTITQPLESFSPTQESSYLGSTIDSRYLIKRLVGRGGMGTVYEVEHIHMQKTLAMKLLHEDMVVRKQLIGRFTREARAISRLSNEHTVRVYDFGRHQAVFFLVMEFLDGEDLEVDLSRNGALPWRRALTILDQICESLGEAHSAGIIHRDLKPENIMMLKEPAGEDYVKVLDFGLAKISNSEDVFSVHSHRDLFGTPFYMSPEQIRAEEIDHRADIYSLGCLAFRLLTNQHVYDAPYAFDVLRQHLTSPIPSTARARPELTIPARVDRFVWRALAKRPENRFPDCAAMRQEIAGCLADPDGESLALPSSVPEPPASLEIDDELKARLHAFEDSHREAEARMNAVEMPPDLPLREDSVEVPFESPAPEPPPAVLREPTIDTGLPPVTVPPRVVDRSPIVGRPVAETEYEEDQARAFNESIDSDLGHDDGLDDGPVYAKTMRRNRKVRLGFAFVAVVIAVTAVVMLVARHDGESNSAAEKEPNNQANQSNPIASGVAVSGHMGNRLSRFESDRDTYRLKGEKAGQFLTVELTAVGNLDLYVDLLNVDGRRVGRIDNDGIGQVEHLKRFVVPEQELLLVVSEAKPGDANPTENVTDAYSLTATLSDALPSPGETEPNNTVADANQYRSGEQINGNLDGPKDIDFYEVTSGYKGSGHRFSIALETEGRIVPRVSVYRVGGSTPLLVFADEGRAGLLRTYFEEPGHPEATYLLAVEHAGRGARSGSYKLVAELQRSASRIAEEPNNDRSRATSVAIGQEVHGVLEGEGDVDVFAIPVTDPRYREIEVVMAGPERSTVRLALSDLNKANMREIPRRQSGDRAVPQPARSSGPIRFRGEGETYYLTITPLKDSDTVSYSFRVLREMDSDISRPVGGPGF
ncbi:MAG: serine/threonine protein kinase [Myxococcota bacterium]|jgi:serine/threonine protein kinase